MALRARPFDSKNKSNLSKKE